ncbi:hypothetical protein NUG39_14605 [Citrobacter youngae]|uniref:hypothetical protein n=1 Tax=Citrobacter youngae TaxID=133448 RepID=UPI00214F6A99|nr:hypothetical protein [Citrobacter youngae]UUX52753.1 hypothetical protein NUG39_14605 [Citrobacter youngae]
MTIELNIFSGMLEPKKGSLDKNKDLPVYAGAVRAKNKSAAQVMLHGIFLQSAPELADDYFKPKVWEDGEGIPRPELMGVLTPDFFSDEIVWNAETGKPERVLVEPELADDGNQMSEGQTEEKMTAVKPLPANYRAASLVLFGPVEEITATQYGQIMDLVNDEESSQARELMEALSREPRVLALLPERQEELLAHLRATIKETTQWTDIKRPINKWLDTPPVKRDEKKPSMSELATRLRYHTAMGKLSRSMDFDVCSPPVGIEMRINTMLCGKDVEIDDWCAPFSRTPGIHDYHPASIVAIIKTADEKLHIYPGELRKYIDNSIAGFDCVNPPQVVMDIACGRTSAPLPQKNDGAKSDDQTEQTLQNETEIPAVCPSRAAELNRELDAAFANSASNEGEKTEVTEQEDNRLPMDAREIEIAHALNDLLSGRTDIMGKEEAEGVVACTDHIIADVLPLLIIDIATTEFCLSPNFNDDEIHDVATTILDGWSDDAALRQKIALDAIVEYRRPEPPKPIVIAPAVVTAKPKKKPELPASSPGSDVTNGELSTTLTYRQQLTLAALQGMCANPAYRGDFDELPHMAAALAAGVISAEAEQ